MAQIELTKSATAPAPAQGVAGRPAFVGFDFDQPNPVIGGSVNSVQAEVDDAFEDMKTFHTREPDEIMRMASGHSARLSEIRVKIMRVEDMQPQWRQVRMRQVEPAIEELQRQYTIASRLFSVRELDWKMEAGER